MQKIHYTGFATDRTGQRVRLDGEINDRSNTPRSQAENTVRNQLQLGAYTDVHIGDTRVTGS